MGSREGGSRRKTGRPKRDPERRGAGGRRDPIIRRKGGRHVGPKRDTVRRGAEGAGRNGRG